MKPLLLVGLGGFLGSIARYFVSKLNVAWTFHSIPLGTLAANVVGSLLIGFLTGILVADNALNANLKLFLIVGVCGGFTTFSAFSTENFQLIQNGQHFTAVLYVAASVFLGILSVFGGFYIAKFLTQ